ncbi:MAG TPA: polysaccharide biosynthesis/export family protein [Patescibacteria group bacterium]|nr:polysaccharide biosynthesis/export family protein [Patescibacteria group bacterium]
MIQQRGGEVIRGELVLDSIPLIPEPDEYVINYGDQLDIDFLYDREYSRNNIKVRPDGKITFPLAGEITVAGKTAPEVDSLLTEAFSEIIVDPNITVIVSDFQDRLVYVMGEVHAPGGYPVEDASTLLASLSIARGPTDKGKRNGVLVMRRVAPDHVVGIQVDLTQLLDKHRFDLDIPLRPNDIVYVPKSAIDKTADFVNAMFTIIGRPVDLYLRGWQVWNIETYYEYWRQQGETPR